MAQETSVSFKVFLQKEGSVDQAEVRRFGIDRDVVSNFSYLREKLQIVFPVLQGKEFAIYWKDSDGDTIVITTDDELMIALTESRADVHKLYVVMKPGGASPQPQSAPRSGNGAVHSGVTCDGCNKSVQGFRYKCLTCADFDLCGTCEAAGMHSEHFMVRVPVPITWRPYFCRRLSHHLSKAARKSGDGPCSEMPDEGTSQMGGVHGPYHGRHRGHHRGHHHHSGTSRGGVNWLDTLAGYLSDWSNLPGEAEMPAAEPTAGSGAGATDSANQQKDQHQQQHFNESHAQFLRTIGATVANLLDPLGIDVDIEVRPPPVPAEVPTAQAAAAGVPAEVPTAPTGVQQAAVQKNVTFADETAVKEVAGRLDNITIDESRASTATAMDAQTHDAEGWTLLGKMDESVPSRDEPAQVPLGFETVRPRSAADEEQALLAAMQAQSEGTPEGMAKVEAAYAAWKQAKGKTSQSFLDRGMQTPPQSTDQFVREMDVLRARGREASQAFQADLLMQQARHGGTDFTPGQQLNDTQLAQQLAVVRAAHQQQHQQQQQYQQQRLAEQQVAAQQSGSTAEQQPRPTDLQDWWKATSQRAFEASGLNQIYPNLPTAAAVQHPRPHIAAALEQMTAMGFTNEGGWLTQLLEAHNGDIQKALDVLQPVRK